MILTPLPPHRRAAALAAFARALEQPCARRVFRSIARPSAARRAHGAAAAAHHNAAITLARRLGMARRPGLPKSGAGWDGRALRSATEAYVLLHEAAHFQLAAPARRGRVDFALGPGPETG